VLRSRREESPEPLDGIAESSSAERAASARQSGRSSKALRSAAVVCAAALAFVFSNHNGAQDFEQVWFGAGKMLERADPYAAIGPGRERDQQWPLLYPGPALVIAAPFRVLAAHTARVLFSVLGAGVLALVLTRDGFDRLPLLASYSFLSAVSLGQWTPWLATGVVVPALGLFAAAKPNVGMAALAGAANLRAFAKMAIGAAAVTLLSLVVLPSWPAAWLEATRHAPANVPLCTILPGGPLLLLTLLRWRRPDARMLTVLALVPQNPVPHGAVLMFAAPWRWWEATILAGLSWLVVPIVYRSGIDTASYAGFARAMGQATVWLVYVPMVIAILRRKNRADS
jgi:hypothetical protein